MMVNVVEIRKRYFVVEYTDPSGFPQKKLLSRDYFPMHTKKGPLEVRKYLVDRAMEYSDVDLEVTLGKTYLWLPTSEITKAMRLAGLWTREDYRKNPDTCILEVKHIRQGDTKIKPNTVLQAALTILDGNQQE